MRKNPKEYSGTQLTSHPIAELLPAFLKKISHCHSQRGDLVLALWPTIINPQFVSLTQAVSFQNGILTVKVKDSTLYSLFNHYERPHLLQALRVKMPGTAIKNILFRIG